jgi:crotonobetainyl-CoA:carnitine CoA-transferase CaiB-like acyl-CoA transferase
VPRAPAETTNQVVADPQIKARNMVIEQDHPVLGWVLSPNLPFPVLRLRHHAPIPGAAHGTAQSRDRGGSRIRAGAGRRDGILYAGYAVADLPRNATS